MACRRAGRQGPPCNWRDPPPPPSPPFHTKFWKYKYSSDVGVTGVRDVGDNSVIPPFWCASARALSPSPPFKTVDHEVPPSLPTPSPSPHFFPLIPLPPSHPTPSLSLHSIPLTPLPPPHLTSTLLSHSLPHTPLHPHEAQHTVTVRCWKTLARFTALSLWPQAMGGVRCWLFLSLFLPLFTYLFVT